MAEAAEEESNFQVLYPDEMSLRDKITTVATKVYGADGAEFSPAGEQADRQLRGERVRQPAGLHRQVAPLAQSTTGS